MNLKSEPKIFSNRIPQSYHVNMNGISSLTDSSYFIRDKEYSKILWMNKVDGLQEDIEFQVTAIPPERLSKLSKRIWWRENKKVFYHMVFPICII